MSGRATVWRPLPSSRARLPQRLCDRAQPSAARPGLRASAAALRWSGGHPPGRIGPHPQPVRGSPPAPRCAAPDKAPPVRSPAEGSEYPLPPPGGAAGTRRAARARIPNPSPARLQPRRAPGARAARHRRPRTTHAPTGMLRRAPGQAGSVLAAAVQVRTSAAFRPHPVGGVHDGRLLGQSAGSPPIVGGLDYDPSRCGAVPLHRVDLPASGPHPPTRAGGAATRVGGRGECA